ncbi:MAG: hypothetical protein WC856_19430, partial [Methylococcaceae bacterium]
MADKGARYCRLRSIGSLQALPEIDEGLVGRVNANQAHARELKVYDHIKSERYRGRKNHHVKPVPNFTEGIVVTGQQRANETQPGKQQKDGQWRVILGCHSP